MRIKLILTGLVLHLAACSNNGSDGGVTPPMEKDQPEATVTTNLPLEKLTLPAGYKISVFAEEVPNARSLARGPQGTIFVGNRSEDKVYALRDADRDGVAEEKYTIATGLRMPNGVAVKNGDLYIAEVSRILRLNDIERNLANPPQPEVVYDAYPTDRHHGWKYIAFGPDGMLYVPVGAPCNICNPDEEIYATITKLDVENPDAQPQIVARGVRNTVGFAWQPGTNQLWFTENGGDNLGKDMADAGRIPEEEATQYTDNNPACELNKVSQEGEHFGYPFCHQGNILDPQFGQSGDCKKYTKPVALFTPHSAPLGMMFIDQGGSSADKGAVLAARHGSWNRTQKSGYDVVKVDPQTGQVSSFITGWLNEASNESWGRPVDLLELPNGDILISDDQAGAIYRVWYEG
jgi:glucose/arabinose dehydrogenase